jgi:nucleoside-diphosphate-sugar epimerase
VPITSRTPCSPVEAYGRAKLAGERAVQRICGDAKLPLILIRPRTLLGKGRLGIFQLFFDWIRRGRPIYLIGNGNNPFQFLQAEDLIEAYMAAYEKNRPGIYNLGTDRFGTVREALEKLIQYARSKSRITALPVEPSIALLKILDLLHLSPLAPWHYLTSHKPFYFDSEAFEHLRWKPKYSNDEMLAESYDWFCANRSRSQYEGIESVHRRPLDPKFLKTFKNFP